MKCAPPQKNLAIIVQFIFSPLFSNAKVPIIRQLRKYLGQTPTLFLAFGTIVPYIICAVNRVMAELLLNVYIIIAMKQNNDFQVLQEALRAMVRMHRDYADLLATVLTIIGSVNPDSLSLEEPYEFPANDYTCVITWLMTSKLAVSLHRKPNESWPRYATRLSKYVGWRMDADTLRRRYNSRMEQNKLASSEK